jgi:photosystem II protein PsbQ
MAKPRYKAVLAVILILVATFWVTTASYAAKIKPPKYTAAQIEQIQAYVPPITEMQERMASIAPLIQDERWVDIDNFIHGPLGELRERMGRLSRNLKGSDQAAAKQIATSLFNHLVGIDTAAQDKDYGLASQNYDAALKDLERFLSLAPKA